MKKLFLFAMLAVMIAGGAFAQTHWASFEIKGLGAGLRYEYVITPRFTVGGYFSYSFITIPIFDELMNSIEFGATVRWYPFARRFFTELSLGYNFFEYYYQERIYVSSGRGGYYDYDWGYRDDSGFCLAPGFGWTIDVGKMGGFFLSPGVKFPITIGWEYFNFTVEPYLGFGMAF